MVRLKEHQSEEWITEDNITEIQSIGESLICSFDEYLIEVAKTAGNERYYAKAYRLVASGALYDDPDTALMNIIRFLELRSSK